MGLLSPCATTREVQSLQQRAHVRHEDPLQPSTYIQTSQACSSKESTCQCRRCEFDPWVGKILWSRKWQSTPMDRGAWIKGLTTENAYLLMSFGFVISLRVSGCLKWLRTPTWQFCEKSIDKWMTNLEQAKDIFQVQHVDRHVPVIDLCIYHNNYNPNEPVKTENYADHISQLRRDFRSSAPLV